MRTHALIVNQNADHTITVSLARFTNDKMTSHRGLILLDQVDAARLAKALTDLADPKELSRLVPLSYAQ